MAHGYPDWGTGGPVSTIYSIQDLGELAARLGSIVTHDRRGNIIWYDDFESGLNKWEVETSPAGGSIVWCPDWARSGGFSVKAETWPVDNNYVQIHRDLPYPVLSKIGFEFSVALEQNIGLIYLRARIYDGVHVHEADIMWYKTDPLADSDKLWYFDKTAASLPLPGTYPLEAEKFYFHTFKLVVNYPEHKYERLILDNHSIDMSALYYRYRTVEWPAEIAVTIQVVTDANAEGIAYIDDVILTQNEP